MVASSDTVERLAALDLGSNSFHLLVAGRCDDGWQPLLREGEKVQLAAGMRADRLDPAAIARGLACLQRFAGHLRDLPAAAVSVVGTHALRVAANRDEFLQPATELLGHPVRIIDGCEEARLVYRGAATASGRQFVIDIGGGSTEIILGDGAQPLQLASVPMGCVTWMQYFPGGRIDAANLERAYRAAQDRIRAAWPGAMAEQDVHGTRAKGCSGTLLAVEQVLLRAGWSDGGITREGLAQLRRALLACHHIDAVNFEGLAESRRSVFASGLVLVLALFDVFGLERMQLSAGALREGLIAELGARFDGAGATADHTATPRAGMPKHPRAAQ